MNRDRKENNALIIRNEYHISVQSVQCKKCNKFVDGVIYVDPENMRVTNTEGFMLFRDGPTCDSCLGENNL